MTAKEKMTAPIASVGADVEQPLQNLKTNQSIADLPGKGNLQATNNAENTAKSANKKNPDDLETVSMMELYDTAYPPKLPIVDGLLYNGTYLFVGSPKIGKSFFMAQIGYHISKGIPLWGFSVRQNKHGLTDEEAEKFNINSESMMKMIELDVSILVSGERKTDAELAMEKWIYNVLESSENNKDRKQFFDTSKYKSYLVSNNEKVKYIFDNFLVDKWLREDRKLNNYVHANGIRFVTDNYIYQNKKEDKDKELIETLQNITDIFLSLLSVIDSIKFHSSDYLDALEMDMEPQEGSQYWVCPIIVEYMNDRFDKKLLQYIQDNEENGMRFMAEYYAD